MILANVFIARSGLLIACREGGPQLLPGPVSAATIGYPILGWRGFPTAGWLSTCGHKAGWPFTYRCNSGRGLDLQPTRGNGDPTWWALTVSWGRVSGEGARREFAQLIVQLDILPSRVGSKNRSKAVRMRNNGSGLLPFYGRSSMRTSSANSSRRYARYAWLSDGSLRCDFVASLFCSLRSRVAAVHCYPRPAGGATRGSLRSSRVLAVIHLKPSEPPGEPGASLGPSIRWCWPLTWSAQSLSVGIIPTPPGSPPSVGHRMMRVRPPLRGGNQEGSQIVDASCISDDESAGTC